MAATIPKMTFDIFRYCLPPEALAIWYEKCKEPGWPKHRFDEFCNTLFDLRFEQLKRLCDAQEV